MPRTVLTKQALSDAGVAATYVTPDATGVAIPDNDGETIVIVKNASGAPITVTPKAYLTVNGQALTNKTVSVPATTGERIIGPFPVAVYNRAVGDTDPNDVYLDFSAVTSVTITCLGL